MVYCPGFVRQFDSMTGVPFFCGSYIYIYIYIGLGVHVAETKEVSAP